MALLCGRAGRLTAQNGGFRPGQSDADEDAELEPPAVGRGVARLAATLRGLTGLTES